MDSTSMAMSDLVRKCFSSLENDNKTAVIMYDFSRAFDCLNWDIIREKLLFYGVQRTSVDFLMGFAQDWRQLVSFEGQLSDPLPLGAGVRQGTITGPKIFNIYMNDLPRALQSDHSEPFLYADDPSIVVWGNSEEQLQEHIDRFNMTMRRWCQANKVCLNEEKTKIIKFNLGPSRNTDDESAVPLLGIMMASSSLGWQDHISSLISKLGSSLFVLRKLSNSLSIDVLKTVYYASIEPHIRYGLLLWGNSYHTVRVLRKQKAALRITKSVSDSISCRPIFTEFSILTVYGLYIIELLTYVYSNEDLFPRPVHDHATRDRDKLKTERLRLTTSQKGNLTYMGAKVFNALPLRLRQEPLKTVKQELKKKLINVPLYSVNEFFDSFADNE
ncbi:hypothetical protein GE061_011716 [Apolygus lucorum]|uniref:Uncharacterized protein n=1 Tax=Apolygus lucorum TaxID=248454 RepID=A0A6A4K8M2_APOLU|nr:hypothetical protein GE061_011716 [Apolygus lucorum]